MCVFKCYTTYEWQWNETLEYIWTAVNNNTDSWDNFEEWCRPDTSWSYCCYHCSICWSTLRPALDASNTDNLGNWMNWDRLGNRAQCTKPTDGAGYINRRQRTDGAGVLNQYDQCRCYNNRRHRRSVANRRPATRYRSVGN